LVAGEPARYFQRFDGFSDRKGLYFQRGKTMSDRSQTDTATAIRQMAEEHSVSYVLTPSDALALDISRHSGDDVVPDDVEQLLIALQRAGHLTSRDVIRLQARYLREAKP
jgi:hypothetical protein